MYGVVVRVQIEAGRGDEATTMLHETVVPQVKAMDGFVRGVWLRSTDGTMGRGVVLFETEEQARAAADSAPRPPAGGPVDFQGAEVVEVVAEA
jgi:hypothetical protein